MPAVPRIAPQEAHENVEMGKARLVCAYEEPERFQGLQLGGAISLQEFRSHGASMSWDQGIIFYCASPNEETVSGQAAKSIAVEFSKSKARLLGVQGWKEVGHRPIPPPWPSHPK